MGTLTGYLTLLIASRSKKALPIILLVISMVGSIFVIGIETNILTADSQALPFLPRLLEAFSPDRWQKSAHYGRVALGFLTINALAKSNSMIFGLGPANWGSLLAWKYSAFYTSIATSSLAASIDRSVLADINWSSILGQFGLLGAISFLLFLVSIVRYNWRVVNTVPKEESLLKALSLAVVGIVTAISLESFLGSWFASRSIAFYLWILAGFAVMLHNQRGIDSV